MVPVSVMSGISDGGGGGAACVVVILYTYDGYLNNERSNVCAFCVVRCPGRTAAFRKARFAFFLTGNLARD
eukprot:scaffold25836_cov78-Skeletonema_dohrnii-CCMP3373.AAC.2